MNFTTAKPGERYYVWAKNDLSDLGADWFYDYGKLPGYRKLAATVLGFYSNSNISGRSTVLGWKLGEEFPSYATLSNHLFNLIKSSIAPGHLDFSDYSVALAVANERWAELITGNDLAPALPIASGAACISCKAFNEYAQPNRSDGTFQCYSCRH